ncbi:MAG: hypothetical protein AAFV07_20985, partial [Bacteroidota bacterium]
MIFEWNGDAGRYAGHLASLQQIRQSNFSLLHFDPQQGHIWINKGDSTYLLDREENILFTYPEVPRRVALDDNRTYWLGKYEIELLRLHPRNFKRFLYTNNAVLPVENNYRCRGIFRQGNKLFVATYRGVRQIDLLSGLTSPATTENEVFYAFTQDRNNLFWWGYNDLITFDVGKEEIKSRIAQKNLGPRIWALHKDQKGQVWIGSQSGLSLVVKGKVIPFTQYNGYTDLQDALILFLYEDSSGSIWVGSNMGLYQLDIEKGIMAGFGKDQAGTDFLPSRVFQHMYQDTDGIYWLATEDAGLVRWDRTSGDIRQYDENWGMLTSNMYAVYEDDFGFLWMSSFNGLIRFDKAREEVRFYNEEDGITQNEFNR